MALFYCPCKVLLRALPCAPLVCWAVLHGWRTWDANSLQMVGLWSQNIDMLEKAPNVAPDGFLVRYGIIISLARKVASRVKSDRLKAMLWCRVVLWENSKAGRVALVLVCWAGSLGLWID